MRFFSKHNLSFETKQERGINGRANFHAPVTDSPIVGGCVVQVYSYIYIYSERRGGGTKTIETAEYPSRIVSNRQRCSLNTEPFTVFLYRC